MMSETFPKWSQDQAIAYEAALEAINDVIAGYSEQIAAESEQETPDQARIAWLEMRTNQAREVAESIGVTDDDTVAQVSMEYSAIVRTRDRQERFGVRQADALYGSTLTLPFDRSDGPGYDGNER